MSATSVLCSPTKILTSFVANPGESQDLIDNDDGTFFKRSVSIHKKVLEAFNDSSSYLAVPVRATILSGICSSLKLC